MKKNSHHVPDDCSSWFNSQLLRYWVARLVCQMLPMMVSSFWCNITGHDWRILESWSSIHFSRSRIYFARMWASPMLFFFNSGCPYRSFYSIPVSVTSVICHHLLIILNISILYAHSDYGNLEWWRFVIIDTWNDWHRSAEAQIHILFMAITPNVLDCDDVGRIQFWLIWTARIYPPTMSPWPSMLVDRRRIWLTCHHISTGGINFFPATSIGTGISGKWNFLYATLFWITRRASKPSAEFRMFAFRTIHLIQRPSHR